MLKENGGGSVETNLMARYCLSGISANDMPDWKCSLVFYEHF